MPPKFPAALVAAVLLVAGCSSTPSKPAAAPATAMAPIPSPSAAGKTSAAVDPAANAKPTEPAPMAPPAAIARSSLLSIYLGVGAEPNSGFAKQVLDATAADLRERGFDVRGSSTYPAPAQQGTNFAPLLDQATALNHGTTIATTQRAATYLHVNSPRLVLIASLESATEKNLFGKPVQRVSVAAFLCETSTGEVVWSGRTSLNDAAPDVELAQKLATALLRSAPKRSATSD
jgi:hypothetical protein